MPATLLFEILQLCPNEYRADAWINNATFNYFFRFDVDYFLLPHPIVEQEQAYWPASATKRRVLLNPPACRRISIEYRSERAL